MADVAHYVERLPLYYAQAQVEYKNTTDRPPRPSAYRSGLARIREALLHLSELCRHSRGVSYSRGRISQAPAALPWHAPKSPAVARGPQQASELCTGMPG